MTKYPTLDGVHLDYIRHPDVLPFVPGARFGVGLEFGYGAASRARFERETGLAAPFGGSTRQRRPFRRVAPRARHRSGAAGRRAPRARRSPRSKCRPPSGPTRIAPISRSSRTGAAGSTPSCSISRCRWRTRPTTACCATSAPRSSAASAAIASGSASVRGSSRAIPRARATQRDAALAFQPAGISLFSYDAIADSAVLPRRPCRSRARRRRDAFARRLRFRAARRVDRADSRRRNAKPRACWCSIARAARRSHARVADLPRFLQAGDLLVVNATRVLPARLRGEKPSGGRAEALLLGASETPGQWRALVRTHGRQRIGQRLRFGAGDAAFDAEIAAIGERRRGRCSRSRRMCRPYRAGEAPLPPYIRRDAAEPADLERYQTVFARVPGAVAAPDRGAAPRRARCCGRSDDAGIERAEVVLHVGPGTFRPLRDADLAAGRLHAEAFELPAADGGGDRSHARARRSCGGGRHHDDARARESRHRRARRATGLRRNGSLRATRLRVPGGRSRSSPTSTCRARRCCCSSPPSPGASAILAAYAEAVERGYRFYSYGDAMLIQ